MRRHLLAAMAMAHSWAVATVPGHVAGRAGGVLLGTSRNAPGRRLEDNAASADDDEYDAAAEEEEEEEEDAAQDVYDDWHDDGGGLDDDGLDDAVQNGYNASVANVKEKVQQWESAAESTAWAFYESPPSEWTSEQWDLIFILLFASFAGCCFGAACCAYCCAKEDTDIVDGEMNPLSPRAPKGKRKPWSPRAPVTPLSPDVSVASSTRRIKSKKINHRNEYDMDHYRQYQDENERSTVCFEDDAEALTVDTEKSSCYEPPLRGVISTTPTTSLADYTSVQREKEARMFKAWKESRDGSGNEVEGRRGSRNDYDDWKEDHHAKYSKPVHTGKTFKSGTELDAALAGREKKKVNMKEDKLLEARELQHNFVGYYL